MAPSWPPEVERPDLRALVHMACGQGGQRFLGVSTVAAGDHHGLGADPGRDVIVVAGCHGHPGRVGQQTRKKTSTNARATHAQNEHVVVFGTR